MKTEIKLDSKRITNDVNWCKHGTQNIHEAVNRAKSMVCLYSKEIIRIENRNGDTEWENGMWRNWIEVLTILEQEQDIELKKL